jgi:hypothetical protein
MFKTNGKWFDFSIAGYLSKVESPVTFLFAGFYKLGLT